MYTTKQIILLLQQLKCHPKKSLGQNFLVNPLICQKIIKEVIDHKAHKVIEIGPGLGCLTEGLTEIKDLILIEKDKVFATFLKQKGFFVLEDDALLVDWQNLINDQTVLVSNLPYQISSRILVDRCLDSKPLNKMVLMFQREVAERILSQTNGPNYGLLSVMSQTHWQIKRLLNAGSKDFYPPPQIGSQVLVFTPSRSFNYKTSKAFLKFLKVGFSQRRKQLKKVLLNYESEVIEKSIMTEAFIKNAFKVLNIQYTARPEEISPQKWLSTFCFFVENQKA